MPKYLFCCSGVNFLLWGSSCTCVESLLTVFFVEHFLFNCFFLKRMFCYGRFQTCYTLYNTLLCIQHFNTHYQHSPIPDHLYFHLLLTLHSVTITVLAFYLHLDSSKCTNLVIVQLLNCIRFFAIPWTLACQASPLFLRVCSDSRPLSW